MPDSDFYHYQVHLCGSGLLYDTLIPLLYKPKDFLKKFETCLLETSLKDRYYNKDKNLPDNQISNPNKDENVHRFAPRKELLQKERERQR